MSEPSLHILDIRDRDGKPRISDLKIPYAIKKGSDAEIFPEDAPHRGIYECPECCGRVVRKGGQRFGKRRAHFSHVGKLDRDCCWGSGGESAEHRRACHEVKEAVLRAIMTGSPVHLELECPDHRYRNRVKWIPPHGSKVTINRKASPTDRRPDVLVENPAGQVDLAIEIFRSHAMTSEKAADFELNGFRWVEIEIQKLRNLFLKPWVARAHGGNFGELQCCAEAKARDQAARLRDAARAELRLPLLVAKSKRKSVAGHLGTEQDSEPHTATLLVMHPSFGLIPRELTERRRFIEEHFPEPQRFDFLNAYAFVRRHPLFDDACVVTFGPLAIDRALSQPVVSASVLDALLSEWAESKGYQSTYFAIPNFRVLRGDGVVDATERFFEMHNADGLR